MDALLATNPRNRIVGARSAGFVFLCFAAFVIPKSNKKKICLYFSRSCRVVRVARVGILWRLGGGLAVMEELGLYFIFALLGLAITPTLGCV